MVESQRNVALIGRAPGFESRAVAEQGGPIRARVPGVPRSVSRMTWLRVLVGLALGAVATPVIAQTRASQSPAIDLAIVRKPAAATDTALIPELDESRAADAEIRVALFDVLNGQPVAALARLRSVVPPPPASGRAQWRSEPDRLFLLAECFYRLGMDDSMRVAAEAVLAGPAAGRYGAVLRTQLLFSAYRTGDLARGLSVLKDVSHDEQTTASALVTGLIDYQSGDLSAARAAFTRAQQLAGTGPYADYARYMNAIAAVRADTAHPAAAIASVDAALMTATGEAADQLRLASAQLAADAGSYDQAAGAAARVDPRSASDAAARTVRAWALTRGDHPDLSAEAFDDVADRYPQLPQRSEDRLMAAQSLLAQDRAREAEGAFLAVADSAGTAAQRTAQWAAAPGPTARALVAMRAADMLLVPNASLGKTWVFADTAGVQADAVQTAGNGKTGLSPSFAPPTIVSVAALTGRVDSLVSRSSEGLTLSERDNLRRAVFVAEPADAAGRTARADLDRGVHTLHTADIEVAVGNAALASRRSNLALQIQLLERERASIAAAGDSLGPMFNRLAKDEDSLARVTQRVDEAGVRLRGLFNPQLTGTRKLASENIRQIDSVRQIVGKAGSPEDLETLDREAATAAEYSHVADLIDQGLAVSIAAHPAFALRDTVRLRGERTRELLVQTRRAVTAGETAVDDQNGARDTGRQPPRCAAVLPCRVSR